MAPRNVNFLFFELPGASIFTKIGSDLSHNKFYTAEWHIYDILGFFWVFRGQKEPNLIENQHFRAKSTNFWCSKKFSRPPGSWFITKMAMNLYFSNIYKSILGIFYILTQIHFLAEIRAEFYEILKNWPKSALSDLIKWLKIKISKIPKIDL